MTSGDEGKVEKEIECAESLLLLQSDGRRNETSNERPTEDFEIDEDTLDAPETIEYYLKIRKETLKIVSESNLPDNLKVPESNSTDGIKADEEINDTNKTGDNEETDDAEETLQYLNQL